LKKLDGKIAIKGYALVDLVTKFAYAIRLELQTTTNTTNVERLIPNLY